MRQKHNLQAPAASPGCKRPKISDGTVSLYYDDDEPIAGSHRTWKVPDSKFQCGGFWVSLAQCVHAAPELADNMICERLLTKSVIQLEGRHVRVWWDGEARWYEGIVDTYEDDTTKMDSHGERFHLLICEVRAKANSVNFAKIMWNGDLACGAAVLCKQQTCRILTRFSLQATLDQFMWCSMTMVSLASSMAKTTSHPACCPHRHVHAA